MSHHHGHGSHGDNGHSHGDELHDHGHHDQGHVVPTTLFLKVLITLMILTVITVAVSRQDFGVMNIVVAMVIASIKALLVVLFFMHLKYENPVTWLYAGFPIVLLAVLLAGVFIDNPLRHDIDAVPVKDVAKMQAQQ